MYIDAVSFTFEGASRALKHARPFNAALSSQAACCTSTTVGFIRLEIYAGTRAQFLFRRAGVDVRFRIVVENALTVGAYLSLFANIPAAATVGRVCDPVDATDVTQNFGRLGTVVNAPVVGGNRGWTRHGHDGDGGQAAASI